MMNSDLFFDKSNTAAHLFLTKNRAATQENRSSGFPTKSDTKGPVQLQKMARSMKFRIQGEEELYYPSSENKALISMTRLNKQNSCLLKL